METTEHIASLAGEGRLLAGAAGEAGPEAPVPTCPGWQVRDLLRHTGMVHRWATAFVTEGHRTYVPDGGEPDLDGDELLAWFTDGHALLVDALRTAPADLDCWAFLPAPSPLAFWARRQAHETRIHRVDAESARGGALTPVAAPYAVDGIDELLTGFHARPRSRVRSDTPRTMRLRALDADAVWTVRLSAEPPRTVRGAAAEAEQADCEVSGTASELCLALWNRLPLSSLVVGGDQEVAALWTGHSGVNWS
ncbi:maleylpyruvate isomerase family mycothiol-dependent enzyme [Streptomyces sp. NPDC060022]|uniref:maleylpyruvate isomerase family mycothiol-dependent enzyme n=1 Tax=Streptomyces sp. NPDC060022 TaxID=3347039 RepID=UPI00368D10EE